MTSSNDIVTQQFEADADAIDAIRQLQALGFPDENIRVNATNRHAAERVAGDTGVQLVKGVTPGDLYAQGIPAEEARQYAARQGSDIVVAVVAGRRANEARDVLRSDSEALARRRGAETTDMGRDLGMTADEGAGQMSGSLPDGPRGGASARDERATRSSDINASSVSGATSSYGEVSEPDADNTGDMAATTRIDTLSTTGTYATPTPDASIPAGSGAVVDKEDDRAASSARRSGETTTRGVSPSRGVGGLNRVDEETTATDDEPRGR